MNKKICIIGLGYIGLPTAAMFASRGCEIVGVDVNEKVVDELNKGNIIIDEPYLDELVRSLVSQNKLRAKSEPEEADVFIIAVPTPINKDKSANMTYVEDAAKSILPYIKKGDIVILESTSPPKTTTDLVVPILKETGLKIGSDIFVAHSPERVLPGRILLELVENPRIIGGINEESSKKVKELYQIFVEGEIYLTDSTTAEMCKLMENTYRDVNIALSNELAKISENMDVNAWEIINFANKHPRVNLHTPGPGVGGHCLAVDPWFIVEKNPELAKMISLGRKINDGMVKYVYDKVLNILNEYKGKKKIVLMGISYKPNVDDIRQSPILELKSMLEEEKNFEIKVIDPYFEEYSNDLIEQANDSSLVILGVNHDSFRVVDFKALREAMREPNILDTRNFWDKEKLKEIGFNYYLLGDSK